jgi:hypothetical protein
MDFFELHAYVALANYLHFSKAAASINLSPSALSRMLVRLENEVQVVLIERNSRHIQLTEEGKLFLDFARDVLHRKEDILLKLATGKNLSPPVILSFPRLPQVCRVSIRNCAFLFKQEIHRMPRKLFGTEEPNLLSMPNPTKTFPIWSFSLSSALRLFLCMHPPVCFLQLRVPLFRQYRQYAL